VTLVKYDKDIRDVEGNITIYELN